LPSHAGSADRIHRPGTYQHSTPSVFEGVWSSFRYGFLPLGTGVGFT